MLRFFDTQHNHHLTDHNLTRYFSNVLLTNTIHHTNIHRDVTKILFTY